MKKLVIAEKPSVAREEAKALSCRDRYDGYIEGDEYVVTWALGHLVELAPPESYNSEWKRWTLSSLPMLPSPLKNVVIENTKEQFSVIENLLKRDDISSVIIATDAGREGELVARWILKMAGYNGKCERLWVNSQTEKAIIDGFNNLRPSEEYDNLYKAAQSRAEADWYVGINVTRAMTCFYDSKLSAGRVQTPTLSLITKREDERDKFESNYYYSARANFGTFFASYYNEEGTVRFQDQALFDELSSWKDKTGIVKNIKKEEKKDLVPLAYDLTELQKDANITYGFSAKETLDILQRLYEVHKIVTYPRTDSRCIPPDVVPTLRERILSLSNTPFAPTSSRYLKDGYKDDNPRFVDGEKVSDHHALLPTEEKVKMENLTDDEKKIWSLVVLRFLEVLSSDYLYETTNVDIVVDGKKFSSSFTTVLDEGYRKVSSECGIKSSSLPLDLDDEVGIKNLKEGDEVKLLSVKCRKTLIPPPERYTDATLLSAMEHAGRFVDDENAKANLKNGLGTPATRAEIIEKLVQNRYIYREGKYFIPTEKGREVVRLSPDVLKSAELTGKWEERLEKIRTGEEDRDLFMKDIKKMALSLSDEVKTSKLKFEMKTSDGKTCPYCGGDMMKVNDSDGFVHYVCQRLSCMYEERLIKVKMDTGEKTSSKTITTNPDGKIKVKINKGIKIPKNVYETKIEVVRESKRNRKNTSFTPNIDNKYKEGRSSGGGTLAEFWAISKKREEEKKKK